MKTRTSLRSVAMAAASCAIVPTTLMAVEDQGFAEVTPVIVAPATPAPAQAQAPAQPTAMVMAIQQAATPSIAIQAYADARAANPNDLAAEQAYVRRMAELGLPEMADSQARDLTKRMPDNGMAWAVAAYVSAKRDQVDEAVTDASTAVRLLPNDPFVQRTAGQIVAWYDSTADRLASPPATRAAVDSLRASMQTKQGFSSAYMEAASVYKAANAPATQPAAPQEANVVVPPAYVYPSAPVYDQAPVYSGGYYGGYYGGGYYGGAYPYWYPYGWWPGCSWWWPSCGSVVIINNGHNGFHHGDGDHDRDDFHHGFGNQFGNHQAPFAPHGGFHGGVATTFSGGSPAGFVHGGFTEHLPAGFVPAGSGQIGSSHWGGAIQGGPIMHSPMPGPVAIPAAGHMSGSTGHDFGGGGAIGGGGFHEGGMHGGGFGGAGMGGGGGGMGGGGHR